MTLNDLKVFFAGWLRTARDIKRLRALDNRLLTDIGIDREEIVDRVSGRHRR